MPTATPKRDRPRRAFGFLAAVIAVLGSILAGTMSPASAAGVAETRVGVSSSSVAKLVEPQQGESPGQRLENDGSRPEIVVATGLAAKSVDGLGGVPSHADLNPSQLSNLTRYSKKLPSGAEPTIITRGASGTVQLSSKVPGRVPGSYASYDKVIDASGTTIGYTKTTVAPDGTIVHIKDKLNP